MKQGIWPRSVTGCAPVRSLLPRISLELEFSLTIFSLTPGTGGDGRYPFAGLTKGNDGAFYGTTSQGGPLEYGTIFRIYNNLPPVAPVQTFVRTSGLDLKIKNEDVLAACSDPEGGVVTLQSLGSSAQGATITQTATHILYTPVNGDNDQFTYTVSDAQGVTSTGTIQVQVVSPGGIVQSVTSNGGVLVANFAGIPGFNYEIQRATSPGGPWSTLVTQPAPANGLFSYTDPSPLSPSAFYRLIQP